MLNKKKTKCAITLILSCWFNYISMHNLLKYHKKIYSKLLFITKVAGYIIHDRGVATLGHVTHGTSQVTGLARRWSRVRSWDPSMGLFPLATHYTTLAGKWTRDCGVLFTYNLGARRSLVKCLWIVAVSILNSWQVMLPRQRFCWIPTQRPNNVGTLSMSWRRHV